VANPARTRDLFFVANGTGGHAFAENYEDHLRNVARWRQVNTGAPASHNAENGAPSQDDGRLLDGDAPPAQVVRSVEPPSDYNVAPAAPAVAPAVAPGVAPPPARRRPTIRARRVGRHPSSPQPGTMAPADPCWSPKRRCSTKSRSAPPARRQRQCRRDCPQCRGYLALRRERRPPFRLRGERIPTALSLSLRFLSSTYRKPFAS
jgi:hypothetical protein